MTNLDYNDDDYIAELEKQIAEGRELEDAIPVKARVSKNLTISFGIRLSPEEMKQFDDAAKARGMTLADFMRSATRGAIAGDIDVERASALGEVKAKARELNEALSRL